MKSILSLAIVFITLLSVNTAKAQSGHFNGSVVYDRSDKAFSGKVAGLGSATGYTISIVGQYDCYNNGGNPPTAWSDLDIQNVPLNPSNKPGSYTFTASKDLSCKARWTFVLSAIAYLRDPQGNAIDSAPVEVRN